MRRLKTVWTTKLQPNRLSALVGVVIVLVAPDSAEAYIGPGAGLGAIAVSVALLLGVVLLLIGLVWYPLKRLLKGKKENRARTKGTNRTK